MKTVIQLSDMLVPEQIETISLNGWDVDKINAKLATMDDIEAAIAYLEKIATKEEQPFDVVLDNRVSKVKFSDELQPDLESPLMAEFISKVKSIPLDILLEQYKDEPMTRLECVYYSMNENV